MTVDIENQQHLLVRITSKMPSWNHIAHIVEGDNAKELQDLLEKQPLESVLRPGDSPYNETALHAAVKASATNCLQVLLKASLSQDILDSPDRDGNCPIHVAVKELNNEAVEKLLLANCNPNVRNDQGHAPLHLLAYKASEAMTSDKLTAVMQCTDLLLNTLEIDLEALNNSKVTPLRAAAGKFPCKASSLEEFCRKLVNKGAVVEANTRNVMDKHCLPKISIPSENHPRVRPTLPQIFDFLILNQPNQIDELLNRQEKHVARELANWYMGSKNMLYYLVDRCNEKGVKVLLAHGANPLMCNLNGELPLHRALARGHFPIVNCLIDEMKKNTRNRVIDIRHRSFSLLQKALECPDSSVIKSKVEYDPTKCLRRLFEKDVLIDVNQKEESSVSQTALHIAGATNNQDAMAILLQNGAYLGEHRIIGNQDSGTILSTLMSRTLNKAMDNCIVLPSNASENSEDNLLDNNYALEMNYGFLLPPYNTQTSKIPQADNEATVLFDISQSKEHRNEIKHPLIQTLLYAKWRRVFPLYMLNLSLYLIFVILLTILMYTVKNIRILERISASGNFTDPTALYDQMESYRAPRTALMVFVLLITIYMIVKEVFQIIFTYKSYFRYIENYLEWFLIVAVFVVCCVPLSVEATRHLAAWAMIAAWYEFVLVLGRAPPLAIYITMLRHVSWNFLKLVFLFGFLIIAFSISFNIILQPAGNIEGVKFADFIGFWSTLPRAIVMATGEFEYSSFTEELSGSAVYVTSTVLIFLVFLFLIFLVLMNVMTGLAVTDAKEVVEDAILYSLKSRLELVYLNEQLFIKVPFLRRLLPHLQLLSNEQRRLLVRINASPKSVRIQYGPEGSERRCKLDNRTAAVIRSHRLTHLAEVRAEREGNPTERILEVLTEMRQHLTQGSGA